MRAMPIDERAFEELKDSIRLELTEAESAALHANLNDLLRSVEPLLHLDLSAVEPWQPLPGSAPARADEVALSLPAEVALALAPATRGGYFEVPRTVDDD